MENWFVNEWKIVNRIGKGSFGTVYKAINDDGSVCAIKHISLPRSNEEIEMLLKKGVIKTPQQANNYFINLINNEIEVMRRFNGNKYIVDFYELYQKNKPDGTGVDFYIRMEYVEDIYSYYNDRAIEADDVVKLGRDICTALELCSSVGVAHNDIKPSNIFIGSDHVYKLGDFGVSCNYNSNNLNFFGTLNYISPEIYNRKTATCNTDLYSLGLVMYKLLNGELPNVSKESDEKAAFNMRMSGTKIPLIRGLNKKLMDILLKACSFDEKDRYKNATEMRNDLEKLPHIYFLKRKIHFISNSYEDTIDIFDEKMIEIVEKKRKYDFFKKINTKMFASATVISVTLLCLLLSSILNRNCEIGFINKNGRCVKGYYYCDTGYELNIDNKCQKTIESIEAKATYTCKSGYTLNGDVCVSNDVKEPEYVYKCADGFTLNGTKCEKIESADAVVTYSCPAGYIAAGSQCVTITNIDATSKYTCPDSSYTLSGNVCKKTVSKTASASRVYTCDSNGNLNGTICDYKVQPTYSWPYYSPKCSRGTYNQSDRMCHYSETAKLSYSCSKGTFDNYGNCRYTELSTETATLEYVCPSGYATVGNQCAKSSGITGTPKYLCADGTELKGKKCYATISTDAVGMYSCPTGYVVSGLGCYKNDFPQAIKKYSCSKVYTLKDGKCEKYDIVAAKAFYYDN